MGNAGVSGAGTLRGLVWVLANALLIQFPVNAPEKIVKDGPIA